MEEIAVRLSPNREKSQIIAWYSEPVIPFINVFVYNLDILHCKTKCTWAS